MKPSAVGRLETTIDLEVGGRRLDVRVIYDDSAELGDWASLTLAPEKESTRPKLMPGDRAGSSILRGLEIAAQWIVDLDAGAKADLFEGRKVNKHVPRTDRPPLAPPDPNATASEFITLRPSLGALVRPLLLKQPDVRVLLPYQLDGAAWLQSHNRAILADDMGLGKTLQAITAIRELVHKGSCRCALVVAPRTILATWEAELTRWAPELSHLRVTPTSDHREAAWRAVVGRVHILITNYEQLRKSPAVLTDRGVDVVIADEAHRIRNLKAAVTKGIRTLNSHRFWALTGTPIERDTEDLATLLSILKPDRFSPEDSKLPATTLRSRARPFMLRRRKRDVLSELPDVIDRKETLDLAPVQRRAYDAKKRQSRKALERPAEALQLINELRTICDYAPDKRTSAKLERITEHLVDIRDSGEKAVVFSAFLEPLRVLQRDLGRAGISLKNEMVTGAMQINEREAALQRFKDDDDVVALLASMRATSEGLTLTAANHVLFVNEWWNPSANSQARDRVVRIGQARSVWIYRFMCRDTVEETLDRILERKSELFDQIVENLAQPGPSEDSRTRELLDEIVESELSGEGN